MSRQPILSVLGHVNAGKTTLLDYIRESKITEGEAGQITQMIGASEIPIEVMEEVCGGLLDRLDTDITVPGLMFIDTPGHAAFSSLRKRGGSISDIAILVIDIEEGIQPQTKEAISILKESGTPFVIALNKVDKLNGWRKESEYFTETIQKQSDRVSQELDNRIYDLMGEMDDYDIVARRFDRVDSFQENVAVVPVSAETGLGIPELLMVVTGLSQNYLSDRLEVSEGIGKGTVLEVTQEKGMGTTIDIILYDGIARDDQTVVYGTSEGVDSTEVRALLKPRPMTEIRAEKEYTEVERVEPASGIKISAKDLDEAISGAPVRIADEELIEKARKQVREELESAEFETTPHGIVLKADSLGSLEAVMDELQDQDIKVQKAAVGPVNKNDIVKARDEDEELRSVFVFNEGITEQAKDLIQESGVQVFRSQVIYEILEDYEEWKESLKQEKKEERLGDVSRPAEIRIMPNHVFRSSDPAVVGTKVVKGVLNPGASIMNAEGETIGTAKSVQEQNESVDSAPKGSEVAVSISGATVGRDIEEGQTLLVDLEGDDYRTLRDLEESLSEGEKEVMEEIVEIKDEKNPHWKL